MLDICKILRAFISSPSNSDGMKLLRRADSNFQLRVRKRAMPDSNFQLRVRKDPNFQGRNSIGYQHVSMWTIQQWGVPQLYKQC